MEALGVILSQDWSVGTAGHSDDRLFELSKTGQHVTCLDAYSLTELGRGWDTPASVQGPLAYVEDDASCEMSAAVGSEFLIEGAE